MALQRLTSLNVYLALGGAYYEKVRAHGSQLQGFWMLNELLSATGARDSSGNSRNGTVSGTPILGSEGGLPHGGCAFEFISANGAYVSMGDVAAFEFTSAFTVELFVKFTSSTDEFLVSKRLLAGGGWFVSCSGGGIQFGADTNAAATVFGLTTVTDYNDGLWHHVMCTWNGTTGANGVKIYVDGVEAATTTAVAGTIGTNGARCLIGAHDNTGSGSPAVFADATLQGVALYNAALSSSDAAAHAAACQWTDVTDDVRPSSGLDIEYGTQGTGPLDRIADVGTATWAMNNSQRNSAQLLGYYTPGHANCRTGFTHDIPVKITMTAIGTTYTKFWGTLVVIDPEPGVHRKRRTLCTAHDLVYKLVDTQVRQIPEQLNKTEVELQKAVFEALPWNVQPMSLTMQAALDTYSYAFYDLGAGVAAIEALRRAVQSAWGRGTVTGAGSWTYRNRQANYSADETLVFGSSDLKMVRVPTDRTNTYDFILTRTHPKDVDPAATVVLFSHPAQPPIFVAANSSIELWFEYRNPTDDYRTLVGGTAMVTPAASTDYVANSAANGSGTNLTANQTVTATYYASLFKVVLANGHATLGAYYTTFQVRGKGIYDLRPVTSQSLGARPTRTLHVDLYYQDSEVTGKAIGDIVLTEYETLLQQVESIEVFPRKSGAAMVFALGGEPGAVVNVTEEQTAVNGVSVLVRSTALHVGPTKRLSAEMGTMAIVTGQGWLLGDTGFSELGDTTILGAG